MRLASWAREPRSPKAALRSATHRSEPLPSIYSETLQVSAARSSMPVDSTPLQEQSQTGWTTRRQTLGAYLTTPSRARTALPQTAEALQLPPPAVDPART